jgi:hypothetical protein
MHVVLLSSPFSIFHKFISKWVELTPLAALPPNELLDADKDPVMKSSTMTAFVKYKKINIYAQIP